MALTDTAARTAKVREKPFNLYDLRGLYLEVRPDGGKWWRFRYYYADKEKLFSLGTYPDVSLTKARQRRDEARKLIADGIDPAALRKAEKIARNGAENFDSIAREWHTQNRNKWSDVTAKCVLERIEADLFPYIGAQPVGAITAPELLACLRRTEVRGAIETAHRLRQYCEKIFAYSVAKLPGIKVLGWWLGQICRRVIGLH